MSTKTGAGWSFDKRLTPKFIMTVITCIALAGVFVARVEWRLNSLEQNVDTLEQKVEKEMEDNPTILERIIVIEQSLKYFEITLGKIERHIDDRR